MDDNIGNDEVTSHKQANDIDDSLNKGVKNTQDGIEKAKNLYNHGNNIKNKMEDRPTRQNSDKNKGGSQAGKQGSQQGGQSPVGKQEGKSGGKQSGQQGGSQSGANEAAQQGSQQIGQQAGKQVGEQAGKQAGQQAGKIAAQQVAQVAASKGAEAGASAVGTALAPGVGTLIGAAVGKAIVPIVKIIIIVSVIFGIASSYFIDSLPSYIFNPILGLNEEERTISEYKNIETPEAVYTKANSDVTSEINSAKTELKLTGSAKVDTVFLYACYSASMEQYEKNPEDESKSILSYKVDMILKIIKVLPKVFLNSLVSSTNNSSSSEEIVQSEDLGGGDYTTGSITQLVNKYHSVSSDYVPSNLVETCDSLGSGVLVRSEAADAYSQLWNDGLNNGVKLISVSGYRSYDLQTSLYGDGSDNSVAAPGTSEHQLGLAIDISCESMSGQLTEQFASTSEGVYLENNAYKFGFIIRYPSGKENITGYPYEPWHIRYVGVETATAIHDSGLTMEGYYAKLSGQTVNENATSAGTTQVQVSPFKKQLYFEAFFGSDVDITDEMPDSKYTYEDEITHMYDSLKAMLDIGNSELTIGGGFYGQYCWPVEKPKDEYELAWDDDFGERKHPIYGDLRFHYGIDLAPGGYGLNIYAAKDGTVTLAGWNGGYGNCIIIDHGNGISTLYGHLASINVTAGQTVTKGQVIAIMGSTGDSTGTHLHFGAMKDGTFFDPMELYANNISEDDYNDLLRIVEAEAENQGYEGKVAVAQVIMFRTEAKQCSFHDIIFAPGQFSPIDDGRFWTVTVSDETKKAVDDALGGYQVVNPRCYYFYNPSPDVTSENWDDDSDKIFDRQIGDHRFYLSTVYQ